MRQWLSITGFQPVKMLMARHGQDGRATCFPFYCVILAKIAGIGRHVPDL